MQHNTFCVHSCHPYEIHSNVAMCSASASTITKKKYSARRKQMAWPNQYQHCTSCLLFLFLVSCLSSWERLPHPLLSSPLTSINYHHPTFGSLPTHTPSLPVFPVVLQIITGRPWNQSRHNAGGPLDRKIDPPALRVLHARAPLLLPLMMMGWLAFEIVLRGPTLCAMPWHHFSMMHSIALRPWDGAWPLILLAFPPCLQQNVAASNLSKASIHSPPPCCGTGPFSPLL